jgi:hypothetical protein
MEPTIPSGAEVRLRCGATAAVGDVVAFIRDDHIVLHRVEALSPSGRWVLTRGDACVFPDPLITDLSLILGRVASPPVPAPRGHGRRAVLALCLALLRHGHGAGAYVVSRLRYLALFGRRSPLAATPSPEASAASARSTPGTGA